MQVCVCFVPWCVKRGPVIERDLRDAAAAAACDRPVVFVLPCSTLFQEDNEVPCSKRITKCDV